ncbi:MAG: prepilin-type N-terminal cleavage/methylation domain-containing protein [Bilifractor sp.]|nr:prepilin-type N-terminal cleavage/methylation domain-containing protein [Lachnospiraceae bacterium]MDY2836650.1 prepilin-type N-terminal cleavage/methylation domain-containing protein [Bilifractor sp.]
MFKKLKNSKKGFTLAELLIVVAIIGVLVAISIPIFTSQLEKSRDAVTLSNIRAAYAEAQSAYLTGSSDGKDVVYTAASTGKDATVVVNGVEAKGQKEGLDNTENLPIPADSQAALKTAMGGKAGKYNLTFTYDADGLKSVSATPAS